MLFDWLITGQVLPTNPAAAVRGPKHVVKTGKTPVLEGTEWRKLLNSIPATTLRDLRDRALIATLTYSFARISAALKMKVEDLRPRGAGWRFTGCRRDGSFKPSQLRCAEDDMQCCSNSRGQSVPAKRVGLHFGKCREGTACQSSTSTHIWCTPERVLPQPRRPTERQSRLTAGCSIFLIISMSGPISSATSASHLLPPSTGGSRMIAGT
jgi:hypothetical protein